jgi:hypothetical protein
MEKVDVVINSLWYVFGVGATLFVGMGMVIRHLLKEKKEDKADAKEMQVATIEAVKEVTKAITSLEIVIKTMK